MAMAHGCVAAALDVMTARGAVIVMEAPDLHEEQNRRTQIDVFVPWSRRMNVEIKITNVTATRVSS